MNKVGIVYQWVNIENQKWYIGSHFGFLDDGYISSGKVFQSAYNKHKNKMMRQILYVGPEYRKAEEFFLLYLDAARDRQSYNMKNTAIGGDVSHCFTIESRQKISAASKNRVRKPISEETKNKISKTLTGRKLSKERCENISKKFLGKDNPFFGKSHTKETKDKISAANKGKCHNGYDFMKSLHVKARKKVYSIKLGIYFDSMVECAEYFNLAPSTISNMIANRTSNRFFLTFKMPIPDAEE